MLNFIKNISPVELLIIALILIVFFGSRFIIGLGKTGGETLKAVKGIKKSFTEAVEDDSDQSDKKSKEVSK